MAKRRALARALSGLGEGIGNASSYLLRQTMQERIQDRYDERADRAEEAATRTSILGIIDKLSAGDRDPEQVAQALSMLTKSNIDPASLEGMRPSTHRRLGKQFDESISKATTPEGVPTDDDVLAFARGDAGLKIPGALDEMSGDPFGPFRPEVRAKSEQAGAKRRSLTEASTDLITYKDPKTGAPGTRRVPTRSPELQAGITTGPTAEQEGALKGTGKVAELEVSGEAEVAQGAKVAGANRAATQAVEMSPAAVAARTREAVNKEVATMRATMPLQLELAGKKAAAEIAQAVNKENALNTASANQAAQQLGPFFEKVSELTKGLNNREGFGARVKGTSKVAASYLGVAPEIQQLDQLIAQHLRPLAIAQGVREANVSEKETEQAMKGVGLFAWSTATERRNALRNINDLITLGPVVAARASATATIGERIQLSQSLMKQRRDVEAIAIQMGADVYRDPVLGTLVPVIK